MVVRIVGDNVQFDTSIDKSQNKFDKFAASAGRIGKSLTKWVTTPLIGLGIAAVKSAADMEMMQASFETMLGSASKAKGMLEEMRVFAAKTPFRLPDLANASKTLLGFGVAADKIMPTLKNLGDVAQGNGQRFQQLSLAFAQSQAAGRLMGQDLLQMINAGFNPLQQIAEDTGKTIAQLKEEMEDGAISSEMVAEAFAHATEEGGRFFGGMERASQTLTGLFSTLIDTIGETARSFGNVLLPTLKTATARVIEIAQQFSNLDDSTKKTILTVAAVAAAIGPLVLAINTATKAIAAMKLAMSAVFSPTGLIAAGIIAVGALIGKYLLLKAEQQAQNRILNQNNEILKGTKIAINEVTSAIEKSNEERINELELIRDRQLVELELQKVDLEYQQKAAQGMAFRRNEQGLAVAMTQAEIDAAKKAIPIVEQRITLLTQAVGLVDDAVKGQIREQATISAGAKSWREWEQEVDSAVDTEIKAIQYARENTDVLTRNAATRDVIAGKIKFLLSLTQSQITEEGELFKLQDRSITELTDLYVKYGGTREDVEAIAANLVKANIENINNELSKLNERAQLAKRSGEEINIAEEKRKIVLTELYKLIDDGVSLESAGVEHILSLYGDLIQASENYTESLIEQGNDLLYTLDEIAFSYQTLERTATRWYDVEKTGSAEVTPLHETLLHTLDEIAFSYQTVERTATNWYNISKTGTDEEISALEIYKRESVDILTDIDRLREKNWRDEMNRHEAEQRQIEETKNKRIELSRTILNATISLFSSLDELQRANTNRTLENLDRELAATLRARGLEEDTTIESLNKQLAEAIKTGDAETAADLRQAIARQEIIDTYAKKKADIEYQGALSAWRLNVAASIAQAAIAILNGLSTKPFIPNGLAAGALASILGGIQAAAVLTAKPQPPALAEGGIIMPRRGGTPVIAAEAGVPEVYAPLDRLGEILSSLPSYQQPTIMQGMGDESGTIHLVVQMDSRPFLDKIFPATRNRTVLISANAVVS